MSKQYYAIRTGDNSQNSLKHYKYIKREKVNGKWRYYYDDGSKSQSERAKDHYNQAVKDRNMDALDLRKTQRELKDLNVKTAANAHKQKLNELAKMVNKSNGLSLDGLKELHDLNKESKSLKSEERKLSRESNKVEKKLEKQKLKDVAHQENIAKAKEWMDTAKKSESLARVSTAIAAGQKMLSKLYKPSANGMKLKNGRISAVFYDPEVTR